eukprot:SAG31_NODE_22771_length_518_cov_0.856802_1_plen_39_part_01
MHRVMAKLLLLLLQLPPLPLVTAAQPLSDALGTERLRPG